MRRKVILSKINDEPVKVHYEIGEEIDNGEYEDLLNQFRPIFEFSLADRIIYEFSSSIIPSFKRSSAFTNEDLENIVRPFKNDYKIKKKTKPKKAIAYFISKSRRIQSKNKNGKKDKKNNKNNKNTKQNKQNRKTQKNKKTPKSPKKKANNKK